MTRVRESLAHSFRGKAVLQSAENLYHQPEHTTVFEEAFGDIYVIEEMDVSVTPRCFNI